MAVNNICMAYITPFHPERGGIGRMVHTLTKELQRRGYNIFYLIYPCAITLRHEYNYPAPLEYLPSSDCMSQENIEFYFDYLKRNNIDVVINHSGNFSDSKLWCKSREIGIKVISVLHSKPWIAYQHLWGCEIWPLRNSTLIEKIKRVGRVILYPRIKATYKRSRINHFQETLPNSDIVCLLSEKYFQELSCIYPGYEEKYKAIANPNSYDNSQTLFCIENKKKQLLSVGLFSPPKKNTLLIKIWRRIYRLYPDWELIIIGDGEPSRVSYLKQLANGIPNIHFMGFQDPLKYYLESSIFCLTSGYEGWPMVLTEAMQCGCVPIAFDSFGSVRDLIIEGENGAIVKPFNLDEFETKLRHLMDDNIYRTTLSKNAQNHIKQYDIQHIADKWEKMFEQLF